MSCGFQPAQRLLLAKTYRPPSSLVIYSLWRRWLPHELLLLWCLPLLLWSKALPDRCPDRGTVERNDKKAVRPASKDEIDELLRIWAEDNDWFGRYYYVYTSIIRWSRNIKTASRAVLPTRKQHHTYSDFNFWATAWPDQQGTSLLPCTRQVIIRSAASERNSISYCCRL